MGQTSSIITSLKTVDDIDTGAIKYLASLPDEEHNGVFALRIDKIQFDASLGEPTPPEFTTIDTTIHSVYYHEHESDEYEKTVAINEKNKPPGTQCMYFVPVTGANYCIIRTIPQPTGPHASSKQSPNHVPTVRIVNLANTKHVLRCDDGPIDTLIFNATTYLG